MNLRIITKNHAADPEIGFLTKSVSKRYWRATAMPTAWDLNHFFQAKNIKRDLSRKILNKKFISHRSFLQVFLVSKTSSFCDSIDIFI